jgi:hypothetical protein
VRGLWESLKEKYAEFTGDGKTTDKIEAVGRWGVEEAQERHDEEASKSISAHTTRPWFRISGPARVVISTI